MPASMMLARRGWVVKGGARRCDVTEVEGSDVIMIFQPRTVTDVITHAVARR